jgi:hypothetical protein
MGRHGRVGAVPDVGGYDDSMSGPARIRVTLDGEVVELTQSELRLQSMESKPCERTIAAHVKNLTRELGDDSRSPRLVLTVHGRGYAFAEDRR